MPYLRQKLFSFTHEFILLALLIIFLMVAGKIDPDFVQATIQRGHYKFAWDVALLSLPMTFVIITGGIDLSIGSVIALSTVAMGFCFAQWHWPLSLAICIAPAIGTLCGLLNGFFIAKLKVHPLIVTLATMSLFRGLAEGLADPTGYSGFPDWFLNLGKRPVTSLIHWTLMPPKEWRTAGLQYLETAGWLFIAVALLLGFILALTRFGRSLYAIGFNETAARYSGLPVARNKILVYMLSGLVAGIVALNITAGDATAKADTAQGIELDVITAVVLGGTSIFGGRGRIIGTVLGVVLIHETRQFVGWHYHHEERVPIVLGCLLILAVAINALVSRKNSR